MKRSNKARLKKYPHVFRLLRKIYRTFSTGPDSAQIQKNILKHLNQNSSIFFVQVGSNDGMQGDPLYDLIVANKNWKGIFIEPVDFLFERLKRNYGNSDRFIFEKKAIATRRGVAEFFYVSEIAKVELGDALPFWYDQLGSFDKNHILKHLDGIFEPYIISKRIHTIPLQDIIDEHNLPRVDLIHIDTEGHDYKVLSTIDFSKCKPIVILYEHKHLIEIERISAELLLKKNGYRCLHYGGDTLATIRG